MFRESALLSVKACLMVWTAAVVLCIVIVQGWNQVA